MPAGVTATCFRCSSARRTSTAPSPSSTGPAGQRGRVGLCVLAHLPGVGENLRDPSLVPVVYATRKPVPPPLPGLQPLHAHLFWRSKPGLVGPDQQPLFFHMPLYFPGMEG